MLKLIYIDQALANAKTWLKNNDTNSTLVEWNTSSNAFYRSLVFTQDGHLLTHGIDFGTVSSYGKGLVYNGKDGTSASHPTQDGTNRVAIVKYDTDANGGDVTITWKGITNNTSASSCTASDNFITANTLAYWTGSTNLHYYGINGTQYTLGTMASKTADNYAISDGYVKIDGTTKYFLQGFSDAKYGIVTINNSRTAVTNQLPAASKTALLKVVTDTSDVPTYSWLDIVESVTSSSANTDIPTAKAVYDMMIEGFKANDAMIFKGVATSTSSGATVGTLASDSAGYTWRASNAGYFYTDGKFYTAAQSGKTLVGVVEAGDLIICITDGSSSTNATYAVVQANLDGAVTAANALTANGLVLGNGNKTVTILTTSNTSGYLKPNGSSAPVWSSFGTLSISDGTNTFQFGPATSATLNVSDGLKIDASTSGSTTTYTLKHNTSVAAAGDSEGSIYKFTYDTYGHISKSKVWDPSTITVNNVYTAYNNTTAATNAKSYDPDGTALTIEAARGLVFYNDSDAAAGPLKIGHANNVTALSTLTNKKIKFDTYGHITEAGDIDALTFGFKNGDTTTTDTYTGNATKTFKLVAGTNVTISGTVDAMTITSKNTWRPVYAWKTSEMANASDAIDQMVADTTDTRSLAFSSTFGYVEKSVTVASKSYNVSEIDLVWAEVSSTGVVSYAS